MLTQSTNQSQDARGLILYVAHRLADLSDWCSRVQLPPRWDIHTFCSEHHIDGSIKPEITLIVRFDSYAEANKWAWLHCKCHDEKHGIDARVNQEAGFFGFPMIDFRIQCSFSGPCPAPEQLINRTYA